MNGGPEFESERELTPDEVKSFEQGLQTALKVAEARVQAAGADLGAVEEAGIFSLPTKEGVQKVFVSSESHGDDGQLLPLPLLKMVVLTPEYQLPKHHLLAKKQEYRLYLHNRTTEYDSKFVEYDAEGVIVVSESMKQTARSYSQSETANNDMNRLEYDAEGEITVTPTDESLNHDGRDDNFLKAVRQLAEHHDLPRSSGLKPPISADKLPAVLGVLKQIEELGAGEAKS